MNLAFEKLKSAQRQLVQSEKLASLGQLTAGIAHEINNPINYISSGIIGLKGVLEDFKNIIALYDKLSVENATTQLQEIKDLKHELDYEELLQGIDQLTENIMIGAVRTTNIVNGLKVFSHQDGIEPQPMELHRNIESTLMLLNHQYKDQIEIIRNYGNIPTVDGFGGEVNQVLMNILSNSIQAIEEKGEITISTHLVESLSQEKHLYNLQIDEAIKEPFVIVSIKDTGKGISEKDTHKIYDPFFTTKEVGKGTGLGLSISMKIVKKHRGFMSVHNLEGQQGAEAVIALPINQPHTL
ncbi:MAG: signal transduction histidine kinase [Flammeovirgaceae bacterium]|jgi:signal transduction histidine kinase